MIPRSLRQRTLRMTATLCLAVSTAFSAQVILMIALVLATGCGGWESPTIALQAFPWMYLGMDANRKDPLTAPVLGVGLSLWALAMGNLVHPHPLPFGFAALLGAGLGLLAQRQPRASSAD
ncbi:MAG: hypothetical protein R3F17_05855 [Planctomycetota bacterium]